MNYQRDVLLIPMTEETYLAVSSDSCGGIGDKKHDVIKVDPFYVGYLTTRVALVELIAIGGEVLTIVDTLSVEQIGTGDRILAGVNHAIKELKLLSEIPVTGSTEENIPVAQTAMGVTVIGRLSKKVYEQQKPQSGDQIVLVGIPKMGEQLVAEEIIEERGEILWLTDILSLRKYPYVHDMIPVGSKGVLYEIQTLASLNHLSFTLKYPEGVELKTSAGPATCLVIALDQGVQLEALSIRPNLCVQLLGHFK